MNRSKKQTQELISAHSTTCFVVPQVHLLSGSMQVKKKAAGGMFCGEGLFQIVCFYIDKKIVTVSAHSHKSVVLIGSLTGFSALQ